MRRQYASSIFVLFTACASSSAVRIPEVGSIVPEAGAPDVVSKCGDLLGYQSKWTRALRLEDWKIAIECRDIPDEEKAWAISYVEPVTREVGIVVDPDSPDIEHTVLHELLHAILTNARQADSELVEEQAVRVLSELAICRPVKTD